MGFYDDRILPHLLNLAMDTEGIRGERRRCLKEVSGRVLEVGFGSGLNLPFYPPSVTQVVGLDPSETSARLARRRMEGSACPVELIGLPADRIPFPDASFDSVVSTFTLCTIPDPGGALEEMLRALRPGGRLHFVEHGRSGDPRVARWQNRLNTLQKTLFGGCHLNRPIGALVAASRFRIDTLENAWLAGAPRCAGCLYRGVATRPE